MSINIERLKRDRAYWDGVAPEGATHVIPGKFATGFSWFKKIHNYKWMVFSRHEEGSRLRWCDSPGTSDGDHFIPRPEPCLVKRGENPLSKQKAVPYQLGDDHPARRIGELGNQAHALCCTLQNDGEFAEALNLIAGRLWDLEKEYLEKLKNEEVRDGLVKLIEDCRMTPGYIADTILAAGWQKGDNSE